MDLDIPVTWKMNGLSNGEHGFRFLQYQNKVKENQV